MSEFFDFLHIFHAGISQVYSGRISRKTSRTFHGRISKAAPLAIAAQLPECEENNWKKWIKKFKTSSEISAWFFRKFPGGFPKHIAEGSPQIILAFMCEGILKIIKIYEWEIDELLIEILNFYIYTWGQFLNEPMEAVL